jgi:hypothetical protein
MPRRHAPRHSGKSSVLRVPADPPQRRRLRYQWPAVVAALALLAGTGAAVHEAGSHATTAAYSAANCAAAPKLAADSAAAASTTTPLGVNATSTSQLTSDTAEFGHLSAIRVYYTGLPDPNAWTTGAPGINKSVVVASFRVPPATILSGADDGALAHFFDTAPTGHPIYYSYYHEPEPFITDGSFTLAQYKAAWTHIVAIADAAHNPDLHSTLILMSWDLDPASGFNFRNFLPAGNVISTLAWDAYPAGTVHDQNPQAQSPADFMAPEIAASKSVALPFGFAEFALGTQIGRPAWLTEVASYLQSTGALFGTLFNSTGFPWMELNDSASIQAWRDAVARSDGNAPNPPAPPAPPAPVASASPAPTSSSPAPSPTPSQSATPTPGPTALPGAPLITVPAVSPAAFAPTGANHVRVMFKLSQPADIAICVMNSQGTVVRELDRAAQPAGWSSSWYLGHDSAGNLLPAGNYPILIVASNPAGTATADTQLTITSQ